MAKPNYLDPENLANALRGISKVLYSYADNIIKGKNLSPEDATALESFAVTLNSSAKTISDLNKDINRIKEIVNK